MGFLNSALLFGAAAVVLPIILHWWSRRPPRVVHWGAMHLFDTELTDKSKRFDWKTLLLLLIRCAIPVCLATCLARPVLTAFILPGSSGSLAIAIVLDDSLSMSYSTGDESNFAKASREIVEIVQANPDAEVSIWLAGAPPKLIFSAARTNPVSLERRLSALRPACGKLNIENAISAARTQLDQSKSSNKHIIIVSDFLREDWAAFTKANTGSSTTNSHQMHLIDVGVRATPGENLSLHNEVGSPFRCIAGKPVSLLYRVTNHGKEPLQTSVTLHIDGQPIQSNEITVAATQSSVVEFPVLISASGSYLVEASLDDSSFIADNRAARILEVAEAPRILIIHGELSSNPALTKGLSYLELALAPFGTNTSDPTSNIQPPSDTTQINRFAVTSLDEAAAIRSVESEGIDFLEDFQAIILLETKPLEELLRLIEPYVRNGGGLLILPADKQADQLPSILPLPARFDEFIYQEDGLRVAATQIQTPGFQVFNSKSAGQIADIQFKNWWRFSDLEAANTLLSLSNGDPLLISKTVDRGRIVMSAASVGEARSDMAFRPAFVALIQTTIEYCISESQNPNLQCGESFKLCSTETLRKPPELFVNEQKVGLQEIGGNWVLQDTRYAGIYSVAKDTLDSVLNSEPLLEKITVQPNASESAFARLDQNEFNELKRRHSSSRHTKAREFQAVLKEQQAGREIWRWLLAATLLFLVLETWLAGRLSNSSI